MTTQKIIPIPVEVISGHKYTHTQGTRAIKNGIKVARNPSITQGRQPKPPWLTLPSKTTPTYRKVKQVVDSHQLSTVCSEAMCPNINECWSHGTATLMLMGAVCTRACRFCAVDTGNPNGWLDPDEPKKAARSVDLMQLDYVVLTSVDRDDLPDGGAKHYADTIRAIKAKRPTTKVEALAPDFQGNVKALDTLLDSGLDVFAQNIETVERLTHPLRDPRASYWQTMELLAHAKKTRPHLLTKTSLMLGLGETEIELVRTMEHLRMVQVDILTLGQYLQPTPHHTPIIRYVTPDAFQTYRAWGLERGFLEVASGPLVRSSYRADRVFNIAESKSR